VNTLLSCTTVTCVLLVAAVEDNPEGRNLTNMSNPWSSGAALLSGGSIIEVENKDIHPAFRQRANSSELFFQQKIIGRNAIVCNLIRRIASPRIQPTSSCPSSREKLSHCRTKLRQDL